jgi:GNAT superfamily N-acetyltransferase
VDAPAEGTVAIRRASRDDADALVEIQASASVTGFAHIFPPDRYPFPTQAVRDRWETELAGTGTEIFLAETRATAVGLVAVKPGWLEALYVQPRWWGTGVASRLHDAAVTRLRALGCRTAELWVLEHNARARAFYERRGWRANGATRVVPFPPRPLDVGYTLELAPGGNGRSGAGRL